MSPSEFDLRAALRDGEGDDLDVDRIVAAGRARRGQRRNQLLTAAAAVVLVGGVATGGAVLLGNDPGQTRTSADEQTTPAYDAAGGRAATSGSGASSTADRPAAPENRAAASDRTVACPASFPETLLPGGGSPGQFGSDGPLFAQPVSSVVVCGYGSEQATGTPARIALTGTRATSLVRSLEDASKQAEARKCPVPETTSRLAIIGLTAQGKALRAVTTTLTNPPCDQKVTNGTAVRYGWQPPSGLLTELSTLTPATAPQPSVRPSGKNIGTPIHN